MPPTSTPDLHLPAGNAPLLICLSHLRWNFVYQRPQHLMSRAARSYRVLFFEEPKFDSGVRPRLDLVKNEQSVTVATPVLPEGLSDAFSTSAQRRLLDEYLASESLEDAIVWHYTPMALSFTDHLRPALVIYDCMDELSAFKDAPSQLIELERRLFRRADIVFTGGQSLYEAKRNRHRNVHAFASSIDAEHFRQARRQRTPEPRDQQPIPQPRLGFFGVIDERMDLDLLEHMASARPHWQFVMLGPVAKIEWSALPQRPNIHWLGAKTYEELPAYLAGWQVGVMPFALNEATRFISPTKTPEFLAAGLPVVSTPIADVVRPYGMAGLVGIAEDAQHMTALAEERMDASRRSSWLARVDQFLSGTSWDKTWWDMHRLIKEEGAKKRLAPAAIARSQRSAARV